MRRLLAFLAVLCLAGSAHAVPVGWGAYFLFPAQNDTINGGTSGATETIPVGAKQVIIEDCGAGASGGGGDAGGGDFGGGGGSGAYVKKTFTLAGSDWGKTFTVTAASGPTGTNNANGTDAAASTVVNGTFGTATNLSAGGGVHGVSFLNGQGAGAGGAASGGDVNTAGNAGTAGTGTHLGGTAVAGTNCSTGVGGNGSITVGGAGHAGTVVFAYT